MIEILREIQMLNHWIRIYQIHLPKNQNPQKNLAKILLYQVVHKCLIILHQPVEMSRVRRSKAEKSATFLSGVPLDL